MRITPKDVDNETGLLADPYAAAVAGEGQKIPSDLVPARYLVHFAPS